MILARQCEVPEYEQGAKRMGLSIILNPQCHVYRKHLSHGITHLRTKVLDHHRWRLEFYLLMKEALAEIADYKNGGRIIIR